MTEIDTSQYDAEAVAAVEKHITAAVERGLGVINRSRREAARSEVHVIAQLIADCVMNDDPIPPAWVAQYRYADALRDHLYSDAEVTLNHIDRPADGRPQS
jgi:hypothetical protein